ncbi:Alpha/Beta hydrolase protein [Gongronella butleri]|nr:Alpha/Beta hydrolase protein [Gongronella butleri]
MTSIDPKLSYEQQQAWKQIQQFLPKRLHFTAKHTPKEEIWEHRGHKIHLDRWKNPNGKLRVILHHGVGTNGRQMSMLLGVPLHQAGFELVAIDMPGYGCTQRNKKAVVSYDEWVQIGCDFVDHELTKDSRPIVLYGLSAGGMLAYHVAARNPKVKGIIGMTFLDQRIQQVSDETARNLFMSRVGVPAAKLSDNPLTASLALPMSVASKMSTLVNDPDALKIFLADKSSAGSWATMRFLSSYATYTPALEPEDFDVCPILLTQPKEDKWTPLHLSQLVLSRINKVPVRIVELENAGHYPLEDPGLQQMVDAILVFLNELSLQHKL